MISNLFGVNKALSKVTKHNLEAKTVDKQLRNQQIILDLVDNCTENNIADRLEELTNINSVLRQSRGLFHSPSCTRSEIYALCSLYIVANRGLPYKINKLLVFIKDLLGINYNLSGGEKYFKEFNNLKLTEASSWSGQKYNLFELRQASLQQSKLFYSTKMTKITDIDYNTYKHILSYLPFRSKKYLNITCKHLNALDISLGGTIKVRYSIDTKKLAYLKNSKYCKPAAIEINHLELSDIDGEPNVTRLEILCTILKNKPQIESLTIKGLGVNYEYNEAFKEISRLNSLTTLSLDFTSLSIEHIQQISTMSNLHTLIIKDGTNKKFIFEYIKSMSNLRTLIVDIGYYDSKLSDEDSKFAFEHITTMRNLIRLDIYGLNLTDFMVECISTAMPNLIALKLKSCNISNYGFSILSHMGKLESLDISYNKKITDEAFKYEVGTMHNLISLNFKGCNIGDVMTVYLSHMKNLKWLDVSDNIVKEEVKCLEKRKFIYLDVSDNYQSKMWSKVEKERSMAYSKMYAAGNLDRRSVSAIVSTWR